MSLLNIFWRVLDLANAAKVSTQTITRLERGEELRTATLHKIKSALDDAGIEFIPENGDDVGVRFARASEHEK
ncbi:transcriptional regulator [Neorhizobium sp. T6_25]|uniref:transcriptional regulator n=1 Tax=Neorhizobium sp. T6_25 TaxID=2093833 RepID=UPI000CF9EC2A|nr:transcriptional regulator [Neorhizobium sp. T6_25]